MEARIIIDCMEQVTRADLNCTGSHYAKQLYVISESIGFTDMCVLLGDWDHQTTDDRLKVISLIRKTWNKNR